MRPSFTKCSTSNESDVTSNLEGNPMFACQKQVKLSAATGFHFGTYNVNHLLTVTRLSFNKIITLHKNKILIESIIKRKYEVTVIPSLTSITL